MKPVRKLLQLTGTGFSHGQYYESMNSALKRLNNEYTMLHYPYYEKDSDDFFQAQKNLTNYCVSLLGPLEGKVILEIGCGNGVQALYIIKHFNPRSVTGIDLNEANIRIANEERDRVNASNARFLVDDAQSLKCIASNSVDVLLNIESAFHYPDKTAFLKEVRRVLKPGGKYLIADILKKKRYRFLRLWEGKMIYNFWDKQRYEKEIHAVNLDTTHYEDITDKVIRGWGLYKNWLPAIHPRTLARDLAYRIFYYVNVRMNVLLLRRMQHYCIYVGEKTEKLHHIDRTGSYSLTEAKVS